jgi:ABC-2 type transport system ATP-binding protein
VTVRTAARDQAMILLARAGAEVAATGPDLLSISGLSSERIVALLAGNAIPFAEVSAHRASLEEAYMELTRDAVEYRTSQEAAR